MKKEYQLLDTVRLSRTSAYKKWANNSDVNKHWFISKRSFLRNRYGEHVFLLREEDKSFRYVWKFHLPSGRPLWIITSTEHTDHMTEYRMIRTHDGDDSYALEVITFLLTMYK